jgi:hypothetical protein
MSARIPNGRISFRVNSTLAEFIARKANANFGGNITDYITDVIQKQLDADLILKGRAEALAEEITDPKEWMKRADKEIKELKTALNQVLGIKEQVRQVIEDQNNQRI